MGVRSVLMKATSLLLYGCGQGWAFVNTPALLPPAVPTRIASSWASTRYGRRWVRPHIGCHARSCGPRRGLATMMSRGSTFRSRGESKRQARVSQLVTAELAKILRIGHGIKTKDKIADHVRCKIAVVDVDMSPDLRSAKVFISVYGDVLEKREAYAWCVKNTVPIRRALAAELKGMKRVPELYFKDMDIGAAVDLMALIDKVSEEDDAAVAAAANGEDIAFDDEDEDIEGFEGLTEEDFFTFDFDEDNDEEDEEDEEDVGFDTEEYEADATEAEDDGRGINSKDMA